jgi:hypothetical protein
MLRVEIYFSILKVVMLSDVILHSGLAITKLLKSFFLNGMNISRMFGTLFTKLHLNLRIGAPLRKAGKARQGQTL